MEKSTKKYYKCRLNGLCPNDIFLMVSPNTKCKQKKPIMKNNSNLIKTEFDKIVTYLALRIPKHCFHFPYFSVIVHQCNTVL